MGLILLVGLLGVLLGAAVALGAARAAGRRRTGLRHTGAPCGDPRATARVAVGTPPAEAIGELAGCIAHDVNNLLTVIVGNLELLALRAEERSQGVEDVEPGLDATLAEAGLKAGESASELMQQLLAVSRRQPAGPHAVAAPGAPPVAEASDMAGGNETILLVEDNERVRAHTETALAGLGYRVSAAGDGVAALGTIEAGLRPDLLVTDVVLAGGMTGREVAEAARRKLPGLKVLFISGYAGDLLMENGGLEDGIELLGKPFRRDELATRIRAQLAGKAG